MKKICVALVAALVSLASSAVSAADVQAPTVVDLSQEPQAPDSSRMSVQDSQRYALHVKATNARLQLRVNDVPVVFKIFRDGDVLEVSYNEWLKRGLNVLELQIERFSDGQPYNVEYQVYFQSPTQIVTGNKTVLLSSPEMLALPMRQPIGIRAQSVPQLRIWQSEVTAMTPEEKQKLVDNINSLRTRLLEAMAKGDNAFLASYDKPMRAEVDRAYGRLPESETETLKRRGEIAGQLRKMLNANVNASPELKPDDLQFDLLAGGQLVRITRNDGSPTIAVSRGDLKVSIEKPIYGNIGGLWELLRLQ